MTFHSSLHKPKTATIWDYWYCYATRALHQFDQHGVWATLNSSMFTSPAKPHPPVNGDIWIDPCDIHQVPHVYDAASQTWRPVVSPGFHFPPLPASVGDIWQDNTTCQDYLWDGTDWVTMLGTSLLTSIPTLASSPVQQYSIISSLHPLPNQSVGFSVNSASQYVLEIDGMISIRKDGTCEYSSNYTPDEAAKQFWSTLARSFPGNTTEIEELRKKVKMAEDAGFKFDAQKKQTDLNAAWEAAMGIIK